MNGRRVESSWCSMRFAKAAGVVALSVALGCGHAIGYEASTPPGQPREHVRERSFPDPAWLPLLPLPAPRNGRLMAARSLQLGTLHALRGGDPNRHFVSGDFRIELNHGTVSAAPIPRNVHSIAGCGVGWLFEARSGEVHFAASWGQPAVPLLQRSTRSSSRATRLGAADGRVWRTLDGHVDVFDCEGVDELPRHWQIRSPDGSPIEWVGMSPDQSFVIGLERDPLRRGSAYFRVGREGSTFEEREAPRERNWSQDAPGLLLGAEVTDPTELFSPEDEMIWTGHQLDLSERRALITSPNHSFALLLSPTGLARIPLRGQVREVSRTGPRAIVRTDEALQLIPPLEQPAFDVEALATHILHAEHHDDRSGTAVLRGRDTGLCEAWCFWSSKSGLVIPIEGASATMVVRSFVGESVALYEPSNGETKVATLAHPSLRPLAAILPRNIARARSSSFGHIIVPHAQAQWLVLREDFSFVQTIRAPVDAIVEEIAPDVLLAISRRVNRTQISYDLGGSFEPLPLAEDVPLDQRVNRYGCDDRRCYLGDAEVVPFDATALPLPRNWSGPGIVLDRCETDSGGTPSYADAWATSIQGPRPARVTWAGLDGRGSFRSRGRLDAQPDRCRLVRGSRTGAVLSCCDRNNWGDETCVSHFVSPTESMVVGSDRRSVFVQRADRWLITTRQAPSPNEARSRELASAHVISDPQLRAPAWIDGRPAVTRSEAIGDRLLIYVRFADRQSPTGELRELEGPFDACRSTLSEQADVVRVDSVDLELLGGSNACIRGGLAALEGQALRAVLSRRPQHPEEGIRVESTLDGTYRTRIVNANRPQDSVVLRCHPAEHG